MHVFIYSSDKTQWSLRPFAYLFNRYYSSEIAVRVFGNTRPPFALPPNFTFESVGAFQPVEDWSTDLMAGLSTMSDEVICLMMDDYYFNRRVDALAVRWCYEYMLMHPEVARFDLGSDRLYAAGSTDYCKINYLDVIKDDPQSPYHFSYQASLWQRRTLLNLLVPHETPWESEMRSDQRLRDNGSLVLGTRQGPMRYTIAIQKGKFTPDGGYQGQAYALQDEDVAYITGQGWIPEYA